MVLTACPDSLTLVLPGFKALADPTRLQVVDLLRHQEMCVCDLCDRIQIAQSKLSFHLKILKEANLVHARQQGRWIYYRLNLGQLSVLEQYLAGFGHSPALRPACPCPPD
ncbi:MAG: ArsR/SmtB family transcription factor [Nodosilinea sp.]